MTSLYTTRTPQKVKTAAQKRLGPNVDQWPNEILAELYRTNSYLGRYQVDFQIQGQDDGERCMYGYFLVSQRPTVQDLDPAGVSARQDTGQIEQAAADPNGPPAIRIPVIIEAQNLYSMDVMILSDKTFLPLTERRLAGILVDTVPAEAHPVNGYGLVYPAANEFLPPMRTGGVGYGGVSKSAGLSVLCASLDPTLKPKLARALSTPEGQYLFENNAELRKLAARIASAPKLVSRALYPEAIAEACVKTASRVRYFSCAGTEDSLVLRDNIQRTDLSFLAPAEATHLLKTGAFLRVVDGKPEEKSTPEHTLVKTAGRYSVVTQDGTLSSGYVIPKIYRMDGAVQQEQQLWWEKGGATSLEKVAGRYLDPNIPASISPTEPLGCGVFACVTDAGIEAATEPVVITSRIGSADGSVAYLTKTGARIKQAQYLQRPMQTSPGNYVVPDSWLFLPMGVGPKAASTDVTKMAALGKTASRKITIACGNGEYTLSGGCGIKKYAGVGIPWGAAAVLLGATGLDAAAVETKLKEASLLGSSYVIGNTFLAPSQQKREEPLRSKVASISTPSLEEMVKIAGQLSAPTSVDAILSLGMITPDTVAPYLENMGVLEQAVSECARLVIISRLGLTDISEGAATKAMQGLDRVIDGLGSLQQSLSSVQAEA